MRDLSDEELVEIFGAGDDDLSPPPQLTDPDLYHGPYSSDNNAYDGVFGTNG